MSHITMTVVNHDDDHFIVTTDAPARFEVSLLTLPDGGSGIIMHGYGGVTPDYEQEPSVVYDGSIRGDNSDQCRCISVHSPDAIAGYAEQYAKQSTEQLLVTLECIRYIPSPVTDQLLYDAQQMLAIAYELRRRRV